MCTVFELRESRREAASSRERRADSGGAGAVPMTTTGSAPSGGFLPASVASNSVRNSFRQDRRSSGTALDGSDSSHRRMCSHRRTFCSSGGELSKGSSSRVGAGPLVADGGGEYPERISASVCSQIKPTLSFTWNPMRLLLLVKTS